MAILAAQQVSHPLELVKTVIDLSQMNELQNAVRDIFVHDSVREYIIEVIRATRENNLLIMGASPRGALHLMRASQAMAAIRGSEFARPDDVKAIAAAVLGHRVLPRAELRARGTTTDQVIERILTEVPAPVPVS
jgi:MoxR-like ATPase